MRIKPQKSLNEIRTAATHDQLKLIWSKLGSLLASASFQVDRHVEYNNLQGMPSTQRVEYIGEVWGQIAASKAVDILDNIERLETTLQALQNESIQSSQA